MGEHILKGDMDWKLWFIKGAKKAVLVGLAAGMNEFARYISVSELPTEYVAAGSIAVSLLQWAVNLIKHV
jgi:hypothetical protein